MQCFGKDRLPCLVTEISGNLYGEVNKLDTYSCQLFRGQYLKQNTSVLFEYCGCQAPIGQSLSESSTALQDSNSSLIICASTYGETDSKRIEIATKGSNRLDPVSEQGVRRRRYHSSSSTLEEPKDTSRDSVSKSNNDPNTKRASRKTKSLNKTVDRNAVVTMLRSKILNSQGRHQKIKNLLDTFSNVDYLVTCYLLIKGKPGNMSPGVEPTTLDGIDLE